MSVAIAATNSSVADELRASIDLTWKGMYRVGGLCMLLAGIVYLVGSTLGAYLGAPPGNTEAFLLALEGHLRAAQAAYWLFSLADVLFVPAVLGIYLALKGINKSSMLIAAALLFFFFALDLGITESNTLALIALVHSYALGPTESQAVVYQAAAHWGLATLPIASFFSWAGPSAGWLISALVMRKSIFGKFPVILGIAVNTLGILAGFSFLFPIATLSVLLTPILVLYGIWLVATGRRLFGLGSLAEK